MTDDRKNKVICISALKNYKEWKKDIKEKIEDTQAIQAIDYSKDRADCSPIILDWIKEQV